MEQFSGWNVAGKATTFVAKLQNQVQRTHRNDQRLPPIREKLNDVFKNPLENIQQQTNASFQEMISCPQQCGRWVQKGDNYALNYHLVRKISFIL